MPLLRVMLLSAFAAGALFARSAAAQCNDCWLEVRGKEIVNANTGLPVTLRAVGLGNWLLQEGYMLNPAGCDGCPGTQWQMKRQYLEEGLSIELVEAFYQLWRDRFITREDIDYIASLGFNSVRLPMHYELFLTPEQRGVRNSVINNLYEGHDAYKQALRGWLDSGELFIDPGVEGFRTIDRLIEWCEANGMYVILDMHAAPGAQGSDKNICDGFWDNNLWEFPVFQDVLDRLWLSISDRYKGEPRIAMYEFFNEPNNVPGGGQAIHALTQRLLATVRGNGDNHIVAVHGNGWGNNYDDIEPGTLQPEWGLVYSAHRYWIDPADDWVPDPNPNQINRMANLTAFRDTHTVPVWVGETGENSSAWLEQNVQQLEQAGIGWCHWTYKRHDVHPNAALARIGGPYPTDGRYAIPQVLDHIRFSRNTPNTATLGALLPSLPEPGLTGCFIDSDACAPIGQTVTLSAQTAGHIGLEGAAFTLSAAASASDAVRFEVIDAGQGLIALRGPNGRFVSSENGQQPMRCDRETVQAWERFEWLDFGNGRFGLRGSNGSFVSSQNGQSALTCTAAVPAATAMFTFSIVPPCPGDLADTSGFGSPDGQVDFGDFFALSFLAGPCP